MTRKTQKVEKRISVEKMAYVGVLLLFVLSLIATICFVENEGYKTTIIILEVIGILKLVIIPIFITRYEKRLQDYISNMSAKEYDEFLHHPEKCRIHVK